MAPVVLKHRPDPEGNSVVKLNQIETQQYKFCNMQTQQVWRQPSERLPLYAVQNEIITEFVLMSFCFPSAKVIDRLLLDTTSFSFKRVFSDSDQCLTF